MAEVYVTAQGGPHSGTSWTIHYDDPPNPLQLFIGGVLHVELSRDGNNVTVVPA